MRKVAQSLPPILAASPNGGGLYCLVGGRSHLVRRESVTGLAARRGTLFCVVQEGQANQVRRTTSEGSTVVRLGEGRLDLHDLYADGNDLYAVYTETNEVVRFDESFDVVERWRLPGEADAVHVNCVAMLGGRLLASVFGKFSGHREYKGKTLKAGLVIDVRTGEVLISGLSQPHSILAAGDLLYLCNSELGELLVYRDYKRVKKIRFNGYTRGLAIDADHLYVGLSASRNADISEGENAQVVVLGRRSLEEQGRIDIPSREVYALMPLVDGDLLQSVVVGLGEDLAACNEQLESVRDSVEQLAAETALAQASKAEQGSALEGLNEARAQLEARLDALQQLLNEKEQRGSSLTEELRQREGWLAELREHAGGLTSLREDLESRLRIAENELSELRVQLVARDGRIDSLQHLIDEKEQRGSGLSEQLRQREGWLAELREHADGLTSLRGELESRLRVAESEIAELRVQLVSRDGRIDALQQVMAEKEQRLADLASLSAERTNGMMELRAHADGLTALRGELESRLHAAELEATKLRNDVSVRDERIDTLRQVLGEHERRLSEAAARSDAESHEMVELRAQSVAAARLHSELATRLEKVDGEARSLRTELAISTDRFGELQKLFADKDSLLASEKSRRAEQDRALAELGGRVEFLQRVIADKEQQVAEAREASSRQAAALAELRVRVEFLDRQQAEKAGYAESLQRDVDSLREQLRSRTEHGDALRKLAGEYEARISGLVTDVSAAEQKSCDLAAESLEARERHEAQMEEIIRARERAEQGAAELVVALEESRQQVAQYEADLAASRDALRVSEARLQDVGTQLKSQHAALRRVVESNSWKLSAPLRWARNLLGAVRHGRRPAAYADVLRMPAPPGLPSYLTHAMPTEEASPASRLDQGSVPGPAQAYLDNLFGDDALQRAPEFVGATDLAPPDAGRLRAKAIAFYLPQFHPFPENDAWWGRGFTEWTNVTRAHPQFLGHHQPQLPGELGFYDLRLPEVIRHQVELARQYGIHGFCFHYYWFAGRRLLERPLDLFLESADIDFPFCLCWANENWTRRWDGLEHDVLIAQEHTPENDIAFIRDLSGYLRDPRYIRIDGKPLVIVYRPSILPDCRETLLRWRDYCREAGIGEIFLAMVQFDVDDPGVYGFDAAIEFPPHRLAAGFDAINSSLDIVNPNYAGHVVHYQSIVDSAKARAVPDYPLVRGVFPGWDNEARRPGRGYTFAFATPGRYQEWLESSVEFAETHPVGGEKIVMINAWNEWAEGAHLEPDRRFGHAFLHATRAVLEHRTSSEGDDESQVAKRPRIVFVTHDAHPHGAQYLALHIVQELDEVFGFDVDLVVLGEGRLMAEFERHATIHDAAAIAGDAAALDVLAQRLRNGGAAAAIANTTVSGNFVASLKGAGMRVVSLVHELPGLIASYGLEREASSIASHADCVVFAATNVRDEFGKLVALGPGQAVVRPQGLFTRSRYRGQADNGAARGFLRDRLGLARDSRVVLSVGYGDHRKGLDIFGEVAERLMLRHADLNFVWVGHFDQGLMDEVQARLSNAGVLERFHAPGLDFETDDYYAGADVYALTSREDPFPSVVLESLSVGLPVVAFSGAGGAGELLRRGCGRLAEAGSAAAFADEIEWMLEHQDARVRMGNEGRRIIDSEFSFRRYVFDLLDMAGCAPPRVSVVVPNYNYARLLRERLESIASQDMPVYEVIVLDDASTDDSLEVISSLRGELDMDFELVAGGQNSGSVFRQWLKGVEKATGDYVWIAEADDLAEPAFLSTVLAAFRDDPTVVMSYCQSSAMDSNGRNIADDYLAYTNDLCPSRWTQAYIATGEQEVSAGLAIKNTIPNVSAVVFKREAMLRALQEGIREIGGYRVAGDWLTYLKLLQDGSIAYCPRALNRHRRHEHSVTTVSNYFEHLREVMLVQKFAREHYRVDEGCVLVANAYAQTLYEQFALADGDAPRIEMNPGLKGLLGRDPPPEERVAAGSAK